MKFFQTLQSQYEILGISRSSNQLNQRSPFNERIQIGFSLFGYLIFSEFFYFFHFANSVTEYVEYIEFMSSIFGAIMLFICFATMVFKSSSLFENIDNIEKLIDASERHFSVHIFYK